MSSAFIDFYIIQLFLIIQWNRLVVVWWCLVSNFERLVVKIEKVIDFSKLGCQLHGGTALFNIFQKLLLVSFGGVW